MGDVRIPKKKLTVEFSVGVFAVVGMACLAYLALTIANMKFLDTGFYEISAVFDNVSGLDLGASVEIAGVPVGEVVNIRLNETLARVEMKIRDEVTIREDDIAAIRTKGIIGERYVKIVPGGANGQLKRGGQLDGTESVVEIEDIIGKLIHRME